MITEENTLYISQCLKSLKQLPNQIKDESSLYKGTSEELKSKLDRVLDKKVYTTDFIRNIHLSVISGEYLTNSKEVMSILNGIKDTFNFSELLESDEPLKILREISKRLLVWSDVTQCFFLEYAHFIKEEETKLERWGDTLLYKEFTPNLSPRHIADYYSIYKDYTQFKEITLQLAHLDHNLTACKTTVSQLSAIRLRLVHNAELSNIPDIYQMLAAKCNFLLNKLDARIETRGGNFYFVFNDQAQALFTKIDRDFVLTNLSSDLEKVKDTTCRKIEAYVRGNKLQEKLTDKRSFKDYFFLARYYKHKEDIASLENLYSEFVDSKRNQQEKKLFDKAAEEICAQYLKNIQLTLQINLYKKENKFNPLLKKYKDLYDEYNNFQMASKLKNYYPFLKIAKAYRDYLEENKTNVRLLRECLEPFKKCLEMLDETYEWSVDHHYIAYQLPSDESIDKLSQNAKIKNSDNKVFIASSFVRPLNYDEIMKEKDELWETHTFYEYTCEISPVFDKTIREEVVSTKKETKRLLDDVKEEFEAVQKAMENLEKSVKKDITKTNIEILSIFAVIAMFALGSVQLFAGISDVKGAIIFVVGYACALSIFTLLIWLIFNPGRGEQETINFKNFFRSRYRLVMLGLLVAFICCSFYLWLGDGNTKINAGDSNPKIQNSIQLDGKSYKQIEVLEVEENISTNSTSNVIKQEKVD